MIVIFVTNFLKTIQQYNNLHLLLILTFYAELVIFSG